MYGLSALKVTSVDTFILQGGVEVRFACALLEPGLFCLCEFMIRYLQTRGAELPIISNSDKTKGVISIMAWIALNDGYRKNWYCTR